MSLCRSAYPASQPSLLAQRIREAALIVPCLLLSGNVLAEDNSQNDLQELQALQVTDSEITSSYIAPSEQTGSYQVKRSAAATGLAIDIKETPQTVSTISSQAMKDFSVASVSDALALIPGVVVNKVETDRVYFTSRGFDIMNFETDGVGAALGDTPTSNFDAFMYDRIEVLKGANGLTAGVGNPSATVNMIRKRPTYETQASIAATVGSWNTRRLEADVSGSLNEEGTVRGRAVIAKQSKESYLDRYEKDTTLGYGVIEVDVTEKDLLTFGYDQQRNNANSPMWGALPLTYDDGSYTDYDVSTSTAADWSYWDTKKETYFAQWQHSFDNGWEATASVDQTSTKQDSKLFYVYGSPVAGSDPEVGLLAYPSAYEQDLSVTQFNVNATGPYTLAGREHLLAIGATAARMKNSQLSGYGSRLGYPVPDLNTWDGSFEEPDIYGNGTSGGTFNDRLRSTYVATRIDATDALNLFLGGSYTTVNTKGDSYGSERDRDASEVVPYLGAMYNLTDDVGVYASYTGIFNPQNKLGTDNELLDPVEGKAYEVGVKASLFNDQLLATAAVFYADQDNVAGSSTVGGNGQTVYTTDDTNSRGIELEVSGQPTPRINLLAGFTHVDIVESGTNDKVRLFEPRNVLRVSGTYQVPGVDQLKVGGSVRWQSKTTTDSELYTQDAYTLVDLMASYEFNDNWTLSGKINNLTDERYINSLYWEQGFYGEPRNATVTLTWNY